MRDLRLKIIFVVLLTIMAISGCKTESDDSKTLTSSGTLDVSKLTPSCFEPNADNPILKSGDLFTGSTWNDPHVLKVDDQYVMYASSDISFNHDIKIYRLISTNMTDWTRSPTTAVFSKGTSGTWDDKATETPSVVYYQNQYHLFYTGYQDTSTDTVSTDYRVGHAISHDGISWTRDGASPILTPSGVSLAFNQFAVATGCGGF